MDDYYYDYNEQFYDDDNFYADDESDGVDGAGSNANQSFLELFDACIYPSLMQISSYIGTFLIWNLIFRITTQTVNITIHWQHVISIICGGWILYKTIGNSSIYFLVFSVIAYVVLIICWTITALKGRCGFIVSTFCLSTLIVGEFLCDDPKIWHQIRGTQMIIAMKVISLAFDTTPTTTTSAAKSQPSPNQIMQLPNILEYYGYILCPANCILGPWIPYKDYLMNFKSIGKWQPKWLLWILINICCAIAFLIMSNCIISWFFTEKSWKWFLAYRSALGFRFSHYFVSFLSQSMMLMAGFSEPEATDAVIDQTTSSAKLLGYRITKPWLIEMPRSIVQVVVVWNVSMHLWLKQYVFRVTKPYGIAIAIFFTYIISALLHGINFQLAAVLLSLGIYTYVEFKLRQKLSLIYDACIGANSCKTSVTSTTLNCTHYYKWHNPYVIIVNVFFGLLAIIHLAYLGVMFEASTNIQEQGFSYHHTLKKWSSLDYGSHWIVLISYLFYVLI